MKCEVGNRVHVVVHIPAYEADRGWWSVKEIRDGKYVLEGIDNYRMSVDEKDIREVKE
jgi:hypothetical protein